MIKRTIRFKEWGVFVDEPKTPKPEQLATSDGSLEPGPFTLRTDDQGFIMTGNRLENHGALRKIVLLGGSFVESLYAHETKRFASVLERDLNDSGYRHQIWNAGYSGATLLHAFNTFVNKVLPLAQYVERVLIFTAMSDLRTLTRSKSYWAPDVTHAPVIDPRNGNVAADRAATTEQQGLLLQTFIDAARNFGQEPIVVCSPFRDGGFDQDSYAAKANGDRETHEASLSQMRMINDSARSTANQRGVQVIDAAHALQCQTNLFYDTMHLNVQGHGVMASFLASELKKYLPPR